MVGALGGLCLKNDALWRSHFLLSTFISKANDSGTRMATIAIDTETGKTEVEEWSYSPDVNYADVVL